MTNLTKLTKFCFRFAKFVNFANFANAFFLHRQLFRMISGSSSFFISVAHLQQPTCFQSLVIPYIFLNDCLVITLTKSKACPD